MAIVLILADIDKEADMPTDVFSISICGVKELYEHESEKHTHVISITTPESSKIDALDRFDVHERLSLQFHDIVDHIDGYEMPQKDHVVQIITFSRSIPINSKISILAHCYAGVSRSTAAMIILLATCYPDMPAAEIMARVQTMRPRLWPNLLMIEYADELLGRDGELLSALKDLYRRRLQEDENLPKAVVSWGRERELAFASS